MFYQSPHGDKLRALIANGKLPETDKPRVWLAIEVYERWISEIKRIEGAGDQLVDALVESLNRYKKWIDLELIFDSEEDFLYRQKGQLKLDNTILEEFLPWLIGKVYADHVDIHELILGPTNAFSQLRFDSDPLNPTLGGGMEVRSKDHDFALARPLFLKASHNEDFSEPRVASTHLAYLAAEIKTNLDKTMFQEASATAHDLKMALPSSRYLLLCEWLDMVPISTAVTMIEEVIVLRKARRLSANVRSNFSTSAGRIELRDQFENHLVENPLAPDAFRRIVHHVDQLLGDHSENEQDALRRGWF